MFANKPVEGYIIQADELSQRLEKEGLPDGNAEDIREKMLKQYASEVRKTVESADIVIEVIIHVAFSCPLHTFNVALLDFLHSNVSVSENIFKISHFTFFFQKSSLCLFTHFLHNDISYMWRNWLEMYNYTKKSRIACRLNFLDFEDNNRYSVVVRHLAVVGVGTRLRLQRWWVVDFATSVEYSIDGLWVGVSSAEVQQ